MSATGNEPAWDFSKVFGREKEIQQLESTLQENLDGSALVVLHGVAGSGKSSLIRSYPWKEKGWLLASGKFEEHRKREPYSAIIEALNELVDQWAFNNTQAPVCQMGGFHKLLEEDVEFLKNIIPKAFQVSGSCMEKMKKRREKPPATKRPSFKGIDFASAEAVNAAFRRIISFLCTAKPVVLFLDDIHWADQTSLEVLKALFLCGPIEGLLIAASYRDEEVDENHPANKCIKDIRDQNAVVVSIPVGDLDVESVNQVVSSITRVDRDQTLALAEVIHSKTAGNPFFVVQFLQLLRDESFLTFSYTTFKWEWGDVDQLSTVAKVSDNVADVVATNFHRLPEATLVTLKVASCLGKVMPLDVLCEYFDEFFEGSCSGHTCCPALQKVQTLGLQNVLECAVKKGILRRPDESPTYMWSHDKLQHVAYSLIPESMRPSLHIRLGKLLWKMSKAYPDADWMVFMAADQLNRFSSFESSPSLGREAGKLDLAAAKLSLAKGALFPALEMLRAGAKNVAICNGRWKEDYDLCVDLYSALAEVAVQLGQHEDAMDSVREVEENAKNLEDKFRVQCVMLKSVTSGNNRDYSLGTEKALEVLKLYGEKFPSRLLPGQLFIENQRLKSKLPGGRLEGLMDLPEMTDKRAVKVTRLLLRHLAVSALMQNTNWGKAGLAAFAAVRALNIACIKGISQDTPMGVMWFAMSLRQEGHYADACEYAEFAIKLVDRFPQELGSLHGSVRSFAYSGIFPTMRPFNNSMDGLLESHRMGLRNGEIEKAITGILSYCWMYLCIGLPLGPLDSDLVSYGSDASQLGVPPTVQILFRVVRQAVVNLQNKSKDPTLLTGKVMDQTAELAKFEGNGLRMTLRDINSFRLMLACVYHDWETAEKMVDTLEPYLASDGFLAQAHFRTTYMGLASLVLHRKSGKSKYRKIAKKVIKTFKSEVKRGSVNAHPVLVMLEAEESPTKEGYEKAIRICARLGLIHHEAYLCERAAVYFLEQKDSGWAQFYLAQAYALYSDWGATGKVDAMKEEYDKLLDSSSDHHASGNSALKGRTRYSARDSAAISEVSWSSFSTLTGGSSRTSLRTSVTSSSSSEDGKSDEGTSSGFASVVDWL